jgi:hypothetical protein
MMINTSALIGSSIGVAITFIYVAILLFLLQKTCNKEDINPKILECEDQGFIVSVFNMQGMQTGFGCWIHCIMYFLLSFWYMRNESVVWYAILAIFFTFAMQSFLTLYKEQVFFYVDKKVNIISSVLMSLLVVVFFAFPILLIRILIMALIFYMQISILYMNLRKKWIIRYRLFTFEKIFTVYTPALALLAIMLLIMF